MSVLVWFLLMLWIDCDMRTTPFSIHCDILTVPLLTIVMDSIIVMDMIIIFIIIIFLMMKFHNRKMGISVLGQVNSATLDLSSILCYSTFGSLSIMFFLIVFLDKQRHT